MSTLSEQMNAEPHREWWTPEIVEWLQEREARSSAGPDAEEVKRLIDAFAEAIERDLSFHCPQVVKNARAELDEAVAALTGPASKAACLDSAVPAECSKSSENDRRTAAPAPTPLDALRQEQAAAVMPLIGPLLDAWDGLPNDIKGECPELRRWMGRISSGMEGTTTPQAAAPAPTELAGWQMLKRPEVFYPANMEPTDTNNFRPLYATPPQVAAPALDAEARADAWQRAAVDSGDWLPDTDGWPRMSASRLAAAPAVEGLWQSHGANDSMRCPEASDVAGGATDCVPSGWREALKALRLGLAAGSRSISNSDFEVEYGGALLDAVEERLSSLPERPQVQAPKGERND